jgi:hypothetical protein
MRGPPVKMGTPDMCTWLWALNEKANRKRTIASIVAGHPETKRMPMHIMNDMITSL